MQVHESLSIPTSWVDHFPLPYAATWIPYPASRETFLPVCSPTGHPPPPPPNVTSRRHALSPPLCSLGMRIEQKKKPLTYWRNSGRQGLENSIWVPPVKKTVFNLNPFLLLVFQLLYNQLMHYQRLLEITGDYWRLPEITGDY